MTCTDRSNRGAMVGLGVALFGIGTLASACSRDVQAMTPQQLQAQYGITDAYQGQVATSDGALNGTLVPVTLPDGRKVQLLIPNQKANAPHAAYISDAQGLHPVEVQAGATRDELVAAPAPRVVSRRTGACSPGSAVLGERVAHHRRKRWCGNGRGRTHRRQEGRGHWRRCRRRWRPDLRSRHAEESLILAGDGLPNRSFRSARSRARTSESTNRRYDSIASSIG